MCVYVCVCVYMCLSVCLFVRVDSHISKTNEAIAIKVDTVTAYVTGMHHMFIILTLTFIQVQADLNHEHEKCSIISETVQAMPITFVLF